MNRQLPPRANAIAHIDDLFAGASLATFAEEKLTELLARAQGRTETPPACLAHCACHDEAELLHFLRQRLAHLQRQLH
jgi:hypothetical protein